MSRVAHRHTDADRLRQLEEQVRMANLRACLTPGSQTQRALAREHGFARSGWARVPAAVLTAVGGSLALLSGELGGLPVKVAVVGALALGAWWGEPWLGRVCRAVYWRPRRG